MGCWWPDNIAMDEVDVMDGAGCSVFYAGALSGRVDFPFFFRRVVLTLMLFSTAPSRGGRSMV